MRVRSRGLRDKSPHRRPRIVMQVLCTGEWGQLLAWRATVPSVMRTSETCPGLAALTAGLVFAIRFVPVIHKALGDAVDLPLRAFQRRLVDSQFFIYFAVV